MITLNHLCLPLLSRAFRVSVQLVLALLFVSVEDPCYPADHELVKTVDALATRLVSEELSGCILLKRGDEVLLRRGYGYANQQAQKANDPTMRFDIGSVSKPLVAAAVLRQVQANHLSLDTSLATLFPDLENDYLKDAKASITVEQLLSHTSGLAKEYELRGVDLRERDETMRALLAIDLSSSPGEQHEYSNANYFLLAAILEKVGDASYESLVRESVFHPLGMKSAGFTDQPDSGFSPQRYQSGHDYGSMAAWPHTWGHRGATGILCTVDDLAAFVDCLHSDKLFTAEERADWLRVRDNHYALGWTILDRPPLPKTVIHSGGSVGSRSILAYYPEEDLTLVILLNSVGKAQHEWNILRAVNQFLSTH